MSKKDEGGRNSSFSEKPVRSRLRRLVDWINLTGAKKVHSLIDKVYKRKNLEIAWERVKANRGSGGIDGQNLEAFEAQLGQQLDRLQRELKDAPDRVRAVCRKQERSRWLLLVHVCGPRSQRVRPDSTGQRVLGARCRLQPAASDSGRPCGPKQSYPWATGNGKEPDDH
jgi:hypothetical protein